MEEKLEEKIIRNQSEVIEKYQKLTKSLLFEYGKSNQVWLVASLLMFVAGILIGLSLIL